MTSHSQWSEARDRFATLLDDPASLERDWQLLFEECPFILTDCLSLGVEPHRLLSCKPGRAEADFYFFPEARNPLSQYGVIEIKRPAMRILSTPRSNVICLSADATQAVAQAQKYATDLGAQLEKWPSSLLVLGNRAHVFVIAGLSVEIARKVTKQIHSFQLQALLPQGCKLIPFDLLSETLDSMVPPQIHILHPWYPSDLSDSDLDPRRAISTEATEGGAAIAEGLADVTEHFDDARLTPLLRPATTVSEWDGSITSEGPDTRPRRAGGMRYGLFEERQMHTVRCSDCGAEAMVPFLPKEGRPVFCRDCYSKHKRY